MTGTPFRVEPVGYEAALRDAELAKLRENATYAGDEDPYKHPEEDD